MRLSKLGLELTVPFPRHPHIDPDCREKLHTFIRPGRRVKYFDFTSSFYLYFIVALDKHVHLRTSNLVVFSLRPCFL